MNTSKIRYAVVGLGWIAQDIVLPAFTHAKNSELTALVSDDPVKLKTLARKYKVPFQYTYDDYELCLRNGTIDAVYIALPNGMHREYTERAASSGIHVLCEKAMAITQEDCRKMREVAKEHKIKLMIAYRLHFEEGNLEAIRIVNSGKLGEIRLFNSTFTMKVVKDNVRWNKKLSGGSLYDMGIYSINAVRNLFRDEPLEVSAFASEGETIVILLKFPKNRMATITCSFSTASTASYDVIGTKGVLRVDPAFHHKEKVEHILQIGKNKKKTVFAARDQFAPELVYFSDCIRKDRNIEPSGKEGEADVRIIEAVYHSASQNGKPVFLKRFNKHLRPSEKQAITRFGVPKPRLVHAQGPTKK